MGLTANDFGHLLPDPAAGGHLTATSPNCHIFAYKIQDGTLSGELLRRCQCLLTNTLINNLAFKALVFGALIPPGCGLGCCCSRPDYSMVTPQNILMALPAIALAS